MPSRSYLSSSAFAGAPLSTATGAAAVIGSYPPGASQSRRSSYETPANGYGDVPDQRQRLGFFDMAIFDPTPDRSKSARSSINIDRSTQDGHSHRRTVSRPPSIESMNSSNSVPFAPPPPPPPSAWKKFTDHFSKRVIKRHIKFIIALYASSVLALVPQVANVLGPTPYLANVAVVFMHPSRTVGSQLEVTLFSLIGAVLSAIWIIPCQLAVAAFNQRYLMEGNHSAWAIDAAWFFVGVWIMTTYKARYAKLNCAFVIYTIIGIFAMTRGHESMEFNIHDFLDLMGPMMMGVAICLIVSIVFWPETASEGLGRAFNESLDTSRALLNLSTRSFLLNHKTIALPKSAIEKAQAEVRTAQKKLHNAYREARYEVTYSLTNPADYKEVRVIISALMRHLASMSLVVQNERLLMLGHPDRDDEDLLSHSDTGSSYSPSCMSPCSGTSSESEHDSDESDNSGSDCDCDDASDTEVTNNSGDKVLGQSDYFGDATAADANSKKTHRHCRHHNRTKRNCRHQHHHHRQHSRKKFGADSTTDDDEHATPHKRVTKRSSAAELRRVRQLLLRAENSTEATIKARQQSQKRRQKEQLDHQHQLHEQLQHFLQTQRGGVVTAPPTPSGGTHGARSVLSVFAQHRKGATLQPYSDYHQSSRRTSARTTPASSRPSSIHEEQNLDTVRSFRSLFSVSSRSKTKSKGKSNSRPASLRASFKFGKHGKKSRSREDTDSDDGSGIPLDQVHFATMPPRVGYGTEEDANHQDSIGYQNSKSLLRGMGLRLSPGQKSAISDHQVRKAAEAYRKQKEKEQKRERKQEEREAKAERQRVEKQEQAEAAARAIPPKEVAFGDRKLFMSFLDIVRDPLQRLSDSCSRVMVAMERELVIGLNVEQDRLERIRRRSAQRAAAIRVAELKLAEEQKAAAANVQPGGGNGASAAANAAGGGVPARSETIKDMHDPSTLMSQLRGLIGIKPNGITKEDMEYAEALKKDRLSKADAVHPNKFLQHRTNSSGGVSASGMGNLASPGMFEEDEDEFLLPAGMSYVQYLTQELEHFDKAEAEGLRDFITTHPTLDVGPREEIFLIFFFLFALREIARELLRLGKYVEELEERERQKLEEEEYLKENSWWYCFGRRSMNTPKSVPKARKKLWWPKVVGNFWNWFAWGSYTQVKTSEGYNALIRNTTKNLEHREPRTVQEEKVLVEARNAKLAAEKAVADAAAKQAAERRAEMEKNARQHRRRNSEGWHMLPLHRATTLSAMVQRTHKTDLEMGLGQGDGAFTRSSRDQQPRGVLRNSTRSNSQGRPVDGEWPLDGTPLRRHRSHELLSPILSLASHVSQVGDQTAPKDNAPTLNSKQLGDPSVLGHQEVLNDSNIEPENVGANEASKRTRLYSVVNIPEYDSLQRKRSQESEKEDEICQSKTQPIVSVVQPSNTAPPDLSHEKVNKLEATVFFPKSSIQQDRYPSIARSLSPDIVPDDAKDIGTQSKKVKNLFGNRMRKKSRFVDDIDDSEETGSVSTNTRRKPLQHRLQLQRSTSSSGQDTVQLPARSIFVNVKKPKTWRYRLWAFLQNFKSEEVKFGFKMAAALTFIGLWSWLQWNSNVLATDRGQWASLTVMAVLSPTVGATFSVCAMRIAGTLSGTLWAMLTYLALPRNPYVICAMMLVIAFAGVFLILETPHPKLGIIMLLSYSSITFIMYEGKTTETIYQVCYKRAITVIVGIIIAVIMNTFLWPILARRELRKEIAFLVGRQGVLFAELVNKFFLEELQPQQQAPSHFVSHWGDDSTGYSSEEEEELEVELKHASRADPFREGFVERAEKEEEKVRRERNQDGLTSNVDRDLQRHRMEDALEQIDSDRLAFQHVEHQLQTKLIKILQLLELSGSEPRLKEEFPMKLYEQIVQCCQNILDRLVSMRMAAQLLSPEVRELVTGPMNYYRRDMVGALLLYFSVLSSSLASKSPLPPYLPSARMARLRVIYNVREAIAAHQAQTGEDHYTYIYYYAFSSALEEVIEELELLAILIKPIVGVTLVSSGDNFGYNTGGGDQLNLGPAQLGISPLGYNVQPRASSFEQPFESHENTLTVNMVNQAQSTAGMGLGSFGNNYQQMRLLQQNEAQCNQVQQQLEQKHHHHHHHPEQTPVSQQHNQQQQQEHARQQKYHPDMALTEPPRIIINPQIVHLASPSQPTPAQEFASQTLAANAKGKSKSGSISSDDSSLGSANRTKAEGLVQEKRPQLGSQPQPQPQTQPQRRRHSKHHSGLKVETSQVRKETGSQVSPLPPPSCPVIVMDETLLGGRHAQRYKDALQVAQEASGQQLVQVSSPAVVMPAQIQLSAAPTPAGVVSQQQPQLPQTALRKRSLTNGHTPKQLQHNENHHHQQHHQQHHHQHHHHHQHQHQSTRTDLADKGRLSDGRRIDSTSDGVGRAPSPPTAVVVQPYTVNIPAAVVTPFGSDLVPEAPLPLHQYDDEDYDDGYDAASAYPMQQRATPQQQRQEERRRHAGAGAGTAAGAAGAAAAAAGKGSSPWLSKQKKKSSKIKTIAWSVLALLLIAIAGVLAWYFAVYKKNEDNKSNGNGKGPATGPT
ncbi:hypothetical protein BG004_007016, partial [Podila humilis]